VAEGDKKMNIMWSFEAVEGSGSGLQASSKDAGIAT
jgi:hypothetical protein